MKLETTTASAGLVLALLAAACDGAGQDGGDSAAGGHPVESALEIHAASLRLVKGTKFSLTHRDTTGSSAALPRFLVSIMRQGRTPMNGRLCTLNNLAS